VPRGLQLSDELKDFATSCFARFMRPMQVVRAVEHRFGIKLERNRIQIFDPESAKGKTLGKKRKALFAEVRQRFLKELEEIPIASKMVRLQQLQTHYEKAADDGNVRLALDVLEKAAKEAGGAHSNERTVNLTGRLAVEHTDLTEEDMRGSIASAIVQALEAERMRVTNATKH
jgi:hypothetical protein